MCWRCGRNHSAPQHAVAGVTVLVQAGTTLRCPRQPRKALDHSLPELPEVETTCRGIAPHIEGRRVLDVRVREPRLRWPVTRGLKGALTGQQVDQAYRRAKYILLGTPTGHLIIHLGMSGSLRVLQHNTPVQAHDHVDIMFEDNVLLRFNDPRRFGCVLWTRRPPETHKLLANLGPEPLSPDFSGELLFKLSRKRKAAVKNFIMDGTVVVGVGNIYASEALFDAGVHPNRAAGRISRARYDRLAECIRAVLSRAIESGGSTLRDFLRADGSPGYFQLELHAYGRAGEPCKRCSKPISQSVIGQRSSFFCTRCQT